MHMADQARVLAQLADSMEDECELQGGLHARKVMRSKNVSYFDTFVQENALKSVAETLKLV